MQINWDIVISVVVPFATLILGIFIRKWVEDRPRLIVFLGHTSAINLPVPQGADLTVHTHSYIVRNIGRKSAKDVRLGHANLPAFQTFPPINYRIETLPDGSKEIVIPNLVPKEQITINYLYFPPLYFGQVNTYAKSAEGYAKPVTMALTRQLPKWLLFLGNLILTIGLLTLAYLAFNLVLSIIKAR